MITRIVRDQEEVLDLLLEEDNPQIVAIFIRNQELMRLFVN